MVVQACSISTYNLFLVRTRRHNKVTTKFKGISIKKHIFSAHCAFKGFFKIWIKMVDAFL